MIILENVNELFDIETVPTGHYRLKFKGPGKPPFVTEELFTSLRYAKEAARIYLENRKYQDRKVTNGKSKAE